MAFREDIPAQLPTRQPDGVLSQEMAPDDLENQLLSPKPETPAGPPPQKVMVADASGGVPPMPEQRPAGGSSPDVQAEEPAPTGLVDPQDSRYGDEKWVVMNYVLTQGGLPWLQAAYDVASGRVPPEQFDEVRTQHSKRIEEIMQRHTDFTQAAQKAMPFVAGLGLGLGKPASSVAGTIARGVGTGAGLGAVQGFTSGDPEKPTLSKERLRNAGEGAAAGGLLGGVGGAAAAGARGVVKGVREVGRMRSEERAGREAADQVEARRSAARDRATAKRDEVQQTQKQQADLSGSFRQYQKIPGSPAADWKQKRRLFEKDPARLVNVYDKQISDGSLSDFAHHVNLPQSVVAARLSKFDLNPTTATKIRIAQDIDQVMAARDAFKAQSKAAPGSTPKPKAPAASAPAEQSSEFGYNPPKREELSNFKVDKELSDTPYRGPTTERRKGAVGEPPSKINRQPYEGGKPRKPRANK